MGHYRDNICHTGDKWLSSTIQRLLYTKQRVRLCVFLCTLSLPLRTYHSNSTLINKKLNFLIYKEIQMGAAAKPYMRKAFLIYEKMRKYLVIYEEAVSHIRLCNCSLLNFHNITDNFISFLSVYMYFMHASDLLKLTSNSQCISLGIFLRISSFIK